MSTTCTRFYHIILLFPLLMGYQPDGVTGSSTASTLMGQAMLSMMDAMGNLAQNYNRNRAWSSGGAVPYNTWQGMGSPWSPYAMPVQPPLQGFADQAANTLNPSFQTPSGDGQPILNPPAHSPLDGIWQGQGGELVLVMYGYFRIYANADEYRDGRYQVQENQIALIDPQTGARRVYDFALSEGRMVLRDHAGNLLLFRQLPIPIPPYALFTNRTSAPTSSDQQTAGDED